MEHSIITWIQIPAKDLKRAAAFYETIFHATFFYEELNNIPHAIFMDGKGRKKLLNGAIIQVDQDIKTGVGPILFFNATGNFETILSLVEENGGEVLKEKKLITKKDTETSYTIPNTYIDDKPGYYAHFIDSEGNRMGLYGTN